MARPLRKSVLAAFLLTTGTAAMATGTSHAGSAAPLTKVKDCAVKLGKPINPACLRFAEPGAKLVPLSLVGQNLSPNGRIRAFWGRIRPFEISTFWSGSNAFATDTPGMTAFWGRIRPFWGRIRGFWEGADGYSGLNARWGRIRGFWGTSGEANDYFVLQNNLDDFLLEAQSFWDPLIAEQTGGSSNFSAFLGNFGSLLESRHGISVIKDGKVDAAAFGRLDEEQRARFIVEWYDQLMLYSGSDSVDHWMRTVKWTPAITQQLGGGKDSVIGILDSVVTKDPDLKAKLNYLGGNTQFSDGHGAAVMSLLLASHDNRGVMGFAPNARVVAYNPFDNTGSASWNEVKNGLLTLSRQGANVINLSLGVPGWTLHPDWNVVLSGPEANKALGANNIVMVFAAGNDGTTQSGPMQWDFSKNPQMIVVGSLGADGKISDFSNRPGDVCLMQGATCISKLSDRYILAPGELILVSDNNGGVTRVSGTSFAAPMVAGTIALMHDRWPWLKKFPRETTGIILDTATPVANCTFSVCGRGVLNVEAALSPLNWNNLTYYQYAAGSATGTEKTASQILRGGLQTSTWETKGMYFTAFERLQTTHRDFAIPLSSKLVDQTLLTSNGYVERFQQYLASRFTDWIKSGGRLTDVATSRSELKSGWNFVMSAAPRNAAFRMRSDSSPFNLSMALSSPSERVTFRLGEGTGAAAIGSQESFGLQSDYDLATGGVNPLLGFASGGSYGHLEVEVAPGLRLHAGRTERQRLGIDDMTRGEAREALLQAGRYRARAVNIGASYQAADGVRLTASYTRLDEPNAVLGVQSLDEADFRGGTTTDGATAGADLRLAKHLQLGVSATVARARSGEASDRAIAISKEGITGTAFAATLNKQGIFGLKDQLRLSVSQPLFVEKGYLDFTQIKVVDRQTGEIGPVTERFEISDTKRPWVAEMLYGGSLLNGAGELSAFGRAEQRSQARGGEREWIAGARIGLAF